VGDKVNPQVLKLATKSRLVSATKLKLDDVLTTVVPSVQFTNLKPLFAAADSVTFALLRYEPPPVVVPPFAGEELVVILHTVVVPNNVVTEMVDESPRSPFPFTATTR
jgi:hypothetical protein